MTSIHANQMRSGLICLAGRLLFALLFLTAAPRHFTHEGIQHAAALGVPMSGLLVPLSGLMAIAGGLSVFLGYRARSGGWILAAFLVPVTLWMHAYWKLTDPAAIHIQKAMFAKNLALFGASLLISQLGAGALAFDNRASTSSKRDAPAERPSAITAGFFLAKRRTLMAIGIAALFIAVVFLFAFGFIGAPQSRLHTDRRRAVGAQEPSRSVSVQGASIVYSDSGGNGPVLLCLHAVGHGARDFAGLAQRLGPAWRVIALDFPGQGNSASDTAPAGAVHYAEIVSQFADRLNLSSFAIIGNSIGGAAAIRYAAAHPDRVKALILCDTGGLGEPSTASHLFIAAFIQFFAAGRRGALWYPAAFTALYRHVLILQPSWGERDRITQSAYEIAPLLEGAWRSFADPNQNVTALLPKIECPVLIAWAKNDFVIPLSAVKPYFPGFRQYNLAVFDGGHAAFLEDPDRFQATLIRFLTPLYTRN